MSKKNVQQLSAMDAQMFFVETPSTPNHIMPVLVFDQSTVPGGKLRLKQIVEKMEDALDRAPVFRKKLVRSPLDLDNPYWVDDPHFNIDFHVRHIALPKPGNWRQLCIQLARLLSRPLDTNRPLWEMYVLEGLDNVENIPEGSFAVIFKIQHSMVDGMGFVNVLSALIDDEPNPPAKRKTRKDPWTPQPGPSFLEMAGHSWIHAIRRPWAFSKRAAILGGHMLGRMAKPKPQDDDTRKKGKAPKTILNGTITPSRVYDCAVVSLAEIKKMRNLAEGSTVNDVVLAVVGGGMRRYLEAKSALPETSLLSAVPISVRSETSRQGAAGNEIAGEVVELFTDTADAVARLKNIAAAMNKIKTAPDALGAAAILEITNEIPGAFAGLLARGIEAVGNATGRPLMANTLVSNVPGFTKPIYMLGAKMLLPLGGGPCLNNMGVIHLVTSYCDIFTITVVGCQDLLLDPDLYMQCMNDSFEEYARLAGCRPSAGKSKS